ncbi:hypothetical protein MN116_007522 [Schistosoma mekongi]|uniref:Uncharacterized protein n=1 Tax=Schistosoma mekongi TaxID=38744 RepID=A0AAE1Z7V5_SCHME|nr:hypothetical protein MN116_007522 [Schistosoma mekongi]
MSGLYYRPGTSELNSDLMNQETEENTLNSLLNDVPNYMQPDPLNASQHKSPDKQNRINQNDSSVNIKKISSPSNEQHQPQQEHTNSNANQPHSYRHFNEDSNHFIEEQSSISRDYKYRPQYLSTDYLSLNDSNFEPTNWDWLRLHTLGPGWEEALREIPVTRKEALNLLVIMKKKLLRAASELTFYKERITILQDQLIHQKRNEEKLIRLQAEFKSQSLDVDKLAKKSSRIPLLEKTIKQQEELICRLETLLEHQRKQKMNANLSNYTVNVNRLDNDLLEPTINTHNLNTNDYITSTTLRNLSNENEQLRHTINELNRTVCNLAKQQDENNAYHQTIEQRYREEIDALKEQQNRLEEQTMHKNRRLDQIENENYCTMLADNERLELYKLLDNAELRIKTLEEELERQEVKVPRNPNDISDSRKSHLFKEPAWKYSGPSKVPLGTSDIYTRKSLEKSIPEYESY